MGYREFGYILKYVRENKGISIAELEKLSGVSKRQIYRIESDEIFSTIYTTASLSNALGINLNDYMNVYNEFNSIEEYEEYCHIRKVIESKDQEELRRVVNHYFGEDLDKVEFSTFKQILFYAFATYYTSRGCFSQSQKYCFLALNTSESLFDANDIKKLFSTEFTFVIYTLIEYNYYMLNEKKKAFKLAKNVIETIEKFYLSKNLARNTVPKIIVRSYINLNNNLADSYFEDKNYEGAIEHCDKILDYAMNESIDYNLEYVYLLCFKCYAVLGEKKNAYSNLEKTCIYSYLNNNIKVIERVKKYTNEDYKEYKDYIEKLKANIGKFLKNI